MNDTAQDVERLLDEMRPKLHRYCARRVNTQASVRHASHKVVNSDEEGSTMSATEGAFVLVHGGWHNRSTWDRVTPILEANGFAALTLDLPGAGVHAIAPTSLGRRPFDPGAFAAERSPIAGVTQEERTQAVIALVKAASLCDGKVILVGHSAGGMTISAVAERVPNLLLAVVYIAGFMVPNGMPLLAMLQDETMSSALSPGLFVGDPAVIGATRINAGSTDEAYRSLLKASFYGDVSESEFAQAASQLHYDESNAGALAPSEITPGRYGAVPRHYIRTTQDCAIPLTGQDHMIATVDGAIGGKTMTHTLESSHSPFLSQPANLSNILIDIAVQSLAEQERGSAIGLDT
jgi:pimeloyl-ACP methyl ester carboxylesterase